MSATKPFFISNKEINLFDSMNEELIDEMVGQSVDIYKINTENTTKHSLQSVASMCLHHVKSRTVHAYSAYLSKTLGVTT